MNFHENGLNLNKRLLYTLLVMIFTQVQNLAARWQQWGVCLYQQKSHQHIKENDETEVSYLYAFMSVILNQTSILYKQKHNITI